MVEQLRIGLQVEPHVADHGLVNAFASSKV
jgi:hypothetical protein